MKCDLKSARKRNWLLKGDLVLHMIGFMTRIFYKQFLKKTIQTGLPASMKTLDKEVGDREVGNKLVRVSSSTGKAPFPPKKNKKI